MVPCKSKTRVIRLTIRCSRDEGHWKWFANSRKFGKQGLLFLEQRQIILEPTDRLIMQLDVSVNSKWQSKQRVSHLPFPAWDCQFEDLENRIVHGKYFKDNARLSSNSTCARAYFLPDRSMHKTIWEFQRIRKDLSVHDLHKQWTLSIPLLHERQENNLKIDNEFPYVARWNRPLYAWNNESQLDDYPVIYS